MQISATAGKPLTSGYRNSEPIISMQLDTQTTEQGKLWRKWLVTDYLCIRLIRGHVSTFTFRAFSRCFYSK